LIEPPATTEDVVSSAEEVTPHDAELYLPRPRRARSGVALCLSGGGFRAALFHLGAVRRLNELGVLSSVNTISAVSGGSILAAFLAKHLSPWPTPGGVVPDEEWEGRVAGPFREFTSRNLRTGPLVKRLLPGNWLRSNTEVEALQERYAREVNDLTLPDLPDRPNFIFNAADLAYGVNWIFEKARVGDYQVGYLRPAPRWPVARAVAASTCFPPVFEPMPVPDDFKVGRLVDSQSRREKDERYPMLLNTLLLSDAGIYDNLGLEPVWKTHKVVLVSDGGATFDPDWDKGFIWRLSRYMKVLGNQSTAIRKRWLISSFVAREISSNPYALEGTYWGLGSPAVRYRLQGEPPPSGYSEALVVNRIAQVRTDMDSFSEGERAVLENHGYMLADAAVRKYAPSLIRADSPALKVPHPDWLEEGKVARALKDSDKVKVLGRWR
jgi:NTE family protein